jgi:hypothetical protein
MWGEADVFRFGKDLNETYNEILRYVTEEFRKVTRNMNNLPVY